MNRKQAVILLADGFEETEAVATGDVLKRLGIAVQFAGVNTEYVTSTAGVTIKAHTLLADVDWSTKDAVILPGGLPGAENLRDSSEVMEVLRKMNADGKVVAALRSRWNGRDLSAAKQSPAIRGRMRGSKT